MQDFNNQPSTPDPILQEISSLTQQLKTKGSFTKLNDAQKKLFLKKIGYDDTDLRYNNYLRKNFLALLQYQSPLKIYSDFITKVTDPKFNINTDSDIISVTILKTLYENGKRNDANLINAKSKLNRAEGLAFLLDFAEAVMAGNDQVDSYLAYLKNNTDLTPLTFTEWQKSSTPLAPAVTPQTTIVISKPPNAETQMTPELKNQIANELAKSLMDAEGKGVSVKVFLDQIKTSHAGLSLNSTSLLEMIFSSSSPNPFAYNSIAKVGTPNDHIEIRKNDGSVDMTKLNALRAEVLKSSDQYLIK
jgi:hypothetical protein